MRRSATRLMEFVVSALFIAAVACGWGVGLLAVLAWMAAMR